MAVVLDNQEKYDEALGIYEEVFKMRERVLGAEHPDTLFSRNSILFSRNNDMYLFGVFNIFKRILGGEHPDNLITRDCSASTKRASICSLD
jgi:hypothetical protein